MNADEIVAYFVDEVDPVYDTRQDKGKKIYYAILQSLFPPLTFSKKSLPNCLVRATFPGTSWDSSTGCGKSVLRKRNNPMSPSPPCSAGIRTTAAKKSGIHSSDWSKDSMLRALQTRKRLSVHFWQAERNHLSWQRRGCAETGFLDLRMK